MKVLGTVIAITVAFMIHVVNLLHDIVDNLHISINNSGCKPFTANILAKNYHNFFKNKQVCILHIVN